MSEARVWIKLYVHFLKHSRPDTAAQYADEALKEYRKRYPPTEWDEDDMEQ